MKGLIVACRAGAQTAVSAAHCPWSHCSWREKMAPYQLSPTWPVQSEDSLEKIGYLYAPYATLTLIAGLSRVRHPAYPTPLLSASYLKRQSSVHSPRRDHHSTLSVTSERPTSSVATGSSSGDRILPWLSGNTLKACASRTCARLCVLGCKTIRTIAARLDLRAKRSHAAFAFDLGEFRKEAAQRRLAWHGRSKVVVPLAHRLTKAAGVMVAGIVFSFPTVLASASAVPLRTISTTNWSGYGLAGSGFAGVTGTFNVPAPLKSASCLEETAIWVGVDGVRNHDLLQAGIAETGFTQAGPPDWPLAGFSGVNCSGQVQVYAWWEDLPSAPERVDLPVKVGDRVTVSIFKMSPGWWALAVHDLTAKQSFLLAQP